MANHWKFLVAYAAIALVNSSCGSSSKAKRGGEGDGSLSSSGPANKPGSHRLGDDDEANSDGMALVQEHGVLDADDVQGVLENNVSAFTRCYSRAGDAQRYVEGQVLLRIVISPKGEVEDAHIIENSLGNFAIERCLVVEARNMKFPAPKGGKGTEVEYPLQFRSTREVALTDWPVTTVPTEILDAMGTMQPCEPLSETPVESIVYIEPSGSVGSAGFVGGGPIHPEAAICMLEQMRGWRLRGESGHVLRARFDVRPPAPGAAAVAPPAAAARNKASKKRRR